MADRGFQIKEELLLDFCSLEVPLGAWMKSQMTSAEIKKPEDVAKLQIHVERAILLIVSKVIEYWKILVSLSQHIDDILRTCAALWNLKPKLICSKTEEDKSNVWLVNKPFVNLLGLQ